ncbi:MAG TPA: alpha/beta hydrolase [Thermomicrobiales bacterium]|nr:alpha/beta hydrolase [Thermomicrobiales bacterium]
MRSDAGLDSDIWRHFYTPEEIDEIVTQSETTTLVSGHYPIHVRIYRQPGPAPTVIMAHGIIVYALLLQRMALPFYRNGYNVIHFDLPGTGQSGGPRGGCTMREFMQVWQDAVAYARRTFDGPVYAMGNAEDGVTCYYALANHPDVRAISVHNLFQYGDPAGANPVGSPLKVRGATLFGGLATLVRPSYSIKGTKAFNWNDVFPSAEDQEYVTLLERDPLGLKRVTARMAFSMLRPMAPKVPFEACRTPVQVIASKLNAIWRYETTVGYYERIGGPKELVTLPDKGQWELSQAFHEDYCGHVMNWFGKHGAATGPVEAEVPEPVVG